MIVVGWELEPAGTGKMGSWEVLVAFLLDVLWTVVKNHTDSLRTDGNFRFFHNCPQ